MLIFVKLIVLAQKILSPLKIVELGFTGPMQLIC